MHQKTHMSLRAVLLATGLSCVALFATEAQAAGPKSQYQQDVERCHNTPGINVQACVREAGAAAQAARRGHLTSPSEETLMNNRNKRCERLPAGQRENCMTLMDDRNARKEGSVDGGGILRETTITIPAPAAGS